MSDAPTLRETLESAMEQHAIPDPEPTGDATPEPDAAQPEPAPGRPRDDAGRFAKATEKPEAAPEGAEKAVMDKTAAPGKGKAAEAASPPGSAAKPAPDAAPGVRPPSSWRPEMRERFGTLPPEVQTEIARVARETDRVLQENAQLRQNTSPWQEAVRPYEAQIRASGQEPHQYVGALLQTAHALSYGAPEGKAALLADLIAQFNVPPQLLDKALVARIQGQPMAQQQPAFDPRAEVQRALAEERAAQQEQDNRRVAEEFLAGQPEFWNDLKDAVVARLKFDRSQGGNMTPQQAYDYELRYSEEHQKVLAGRKTTDAAKAQAAAVQRSKTAASSVKPSSAPATRSAGPGTVREAVEAAMLQHGVR